MRITGAEFNVWTHFVYFSLLLLNPRNKCYDVWYKFRYSAGNRARDFFSISLPFFLPFLLCMFFYLCFCFLLLIICCDSNGSANFIFAINCKNSITERNLCNKTRKFNTTIQCHYSLNIKINVTILYLTINHFPRCFPTKNSLLNSCLTIESKRSAHFNLIYYITLTYFMNFFDFSR